jgi:hypothetical protein
VNLEATQVERKAKDRYIGGCSAQPCTRIVVQVRVQRDHGIGLLASKLGQNGIGEFECGAGHHSNGESISTHPVCASRIGDPAGKCVQGPAAVV